MDKKMIEYSIVGATQNQYIVASSPRSGNSRLTRRSRGIRRRYSMLGKWSCKVSVWYILIVYRTNAHRYWAYYIIICKNDAFERNFRFGRKIKTVYGDRNSLIHAVRTAVRSFYFFIFPARLIPNGNGSRLLVCWSL